MWALSRGLMESQKDITWFMFVSCNTDVSVQQGKFTTGNLCDVEAGPYQSRTLVWGVLAMQFGL